MWAKILAFLKKIPSVYYNWRKRNEDLANFVASAKDNCGKLDHIITSVDGLTDKVNDLSEQVTHINGRLEIIGRGTKMELFDTLHSWRSELVARGWANALEKQEVKSIYEIYHDQLEGNGQGEKYYNEIIALPESEEEMLRKRGGN